MFSLSPRTFNGVAIVCAILLVPLLSYGSAMLMDGQKSSVSPRAKLVKAPIAEQEVLPSELRSKISETIALLESST